MMFGYPTTPCHRPSTSIPSSLTSKICRQLCRSNFEGLESTQPSARYAGNIALDLRWRSKDAARLDDNQRIILSQNIKNIRALQPQHPKKLRPVTAASTFGQRGQEKALQRVIAARRSEKERNESARVREEHLLFAKQRERQLKLEGKEKRRAIIYAINGVMKKAFDAAKGGESSCNTYV